jgi:hypothetical protein
VAKNKEIDHLEVKERKSRKRKIVPPEKGWKRKIILG